MSGIFDQIINYSPPLIVSGTVNYKGTWNASTNNPTLNNPPATSTKGDYYVVSTAGTQFTISFAVGDWIISSGTAWEKVDLTDAVSSVFGRTGAVVGVSTDYSSVGLTNTAIGASSPSTGAFTTVTASSTIAATGAVTGSNLSGTNTGDQTISITGDATASGSTGVLTATVSKINGTALSGLATGILKNTTTTGVPSIAVAADFPTLNQNTTGSAATLTTTRAIYGNNFDGSAALTQVIASTYGGTGVNNGANTITIAGNVTHAGAFTQSFTATANTALTLPTTGTLATLAGSEALSNKTITASAFNGTVGATTPSSVAGTTGVFSSYVLGAGTNPGGLGGSKWIYDWFSGNHRQFSMGADASTNGAWAWYSQRSDGSNSVVPMTLTSTGLAVTGVGTFSSTLGTGDNITITKATSAALILDSTNNTTSDITQVIYRRNGTIKWRAGVNIGGTSTENYSVYNETAGAIALFSSTGLAVTGALSAITSGGLSQLTLGDTSSGGYSAVKLMAGSGKYNWIVGAQYNVNNALEITPSTATGGSTFSTPVVSILQTGNVGIGTSTGLLDAANRVTVSVNGTSSSALAFGVGGTRRGHIYVDASEMALAAGQSGQSQVMTFQTNGTERARIDNSGNLLVGTTSAISSGTSIVNLGSTRQVLTVKGDSDASYTLGVWSATTSGDNLFAYFATEASITVRGAISYNRAGGLTVYGTTSDYRAKDISGPATNSGALIDAVPVYMGKMKGATQERPMFIAHETPAYAHTGEKDAVDAEGNPIYQQIDTSTLVPVLWAEIQSLRQRVAALETR